MLKIWLAPLFAILGLALTIPLVGFLRKKSIESKVPGKKRPASLQWQLMEQLAAVKLQLEAAQAAIHSFRQDFKGLEAQLSLHARLLEVQTRRVERFRAWNEAEATVIQMGAPRSGYSNRLTAVASLDELFSQDDPGVGMSSDVLVASEPEEMEVDLDATGRAFFRSRPRVSEPRPVEQ